MILLSPFYFSVLAGDQIKSNIFLVGSGSNISQVNSQVDLPVSFYIGNDLSGVSNPAKSIFFKVSGVYSGGGSVQLKINSDSVTAKTFTLPSVSRPTNFEFIYKDDSGKINPLTAGSYNYTLNVIPAGVSISSLASELEITYQFAPTPCVDGVSNNQKVKTTEFFVGHTDNLGSMVNLPFSIYIGDDLSGISEPVKSAYFLITGVYTGTGTLSTSLGSDPVNNQFFLSGGSTPTNFNLIYNDGLGRIKPTTAGSYNYTLNISQSGLSISNLNIKMVLTHRYKPVNCGASYPPYGDLISAVYDSSTDTNGSAYNSIMWKGKLGGLNFDQGKVRFQLATADNPSGPWTYVGGNTCGSNDWYDATPGTAVELDCYPQFNNKRYFRYKIRLCSDDCAVSGFNTPQVDDVVVNFSP